MNETWERYQINSAKYEKDEERREMKYTPRLKEKWAINLWLKKDILIE